MFHAAPSRAFQGIGNPGEKRIYLASVLAYVRIDALLAPNVELALEVCPEVRISWTLRNKGGELGVAAVDRLLACALDLISAEQSEESAIPARVEVPAKIRLHGGRNGSFEPLRQLSLTTDVGDAFTSGNIRDLLEAEVDVVEECMAEAE